MYSFITDTPEAGKNLEFYHYPKSNAEEERETSIYPFLTWEFKDVTEEGLLKYEQDVVNFCINHFDICTNPGDETPPQNDLPNEPGSGSPEEDIIEGNLVHAEDGIVEESIAHSADTQVNTSQEGEPDPQIQDSATALGKLLAENFNIQVSCHPLFEVLSLSSQLMYFQGRTFNVQHPLFGELTMECHTDLSKNSNQRKLFGIKSVQLEMLGQDDRFTFTPERNQKGEEVKLFPSHLNQRFEIDANDTVTNMYGINFPLLYYWVPYFGKYCIDSTISPR